MKKEKKTIVMTIFVFFMLVGLIFLPSIKNTLGDTQDTFSVTLWLTNTMPTIEWINNSLVVNPAEAANVTVYIQFNASDPNGVDDLDDSTASVVLSIEGEPDRYNLSCNAQGNSGTTETYVCAIVMRHYDRDGLWEINASVTDNSGATIENRSFTMTYNPLTAMVLEKASMNFTNAALGEQNKASDQNPQYIDNRGNQNITEVNVTAYSLVKGSEVLDASDFTINATDGNGAGYQLQNDTMVAIENAFVQRDIDGLDQDESLYLYVDIPSSGLTTGQFDSSQDWIVDVR